MTKMDEIRKNYPEIDYIERNIQPDHVHLVVSFPPKYSVAQVVQIIKQNTGRALKDKFEFLRQRYYGRGGIWSAGYFVSTEGGRGNDKEICLISRARRLRTSEACIRLKNHGRKSVDIYGIGGEGDRIFTTYFSVG